MYKAFLLASNGTRNHNIIQPLGCHRVARDSYENNPISVSMRFIVFLTALACGVCCIENLPSQLLLHLKKKRGINEHSVTFPSESSSLYSSPVHSSLSSGYELGGSPGGFSLGHAGLHNSGGSVGHGIGYSLAPSSGLNYGSGYQSPGLSHGSLSHQSASLGGHSAQSTYSLPSITNLGSGSSNALFTPSKTGPVTFGPHGGGGGAATSGSSSSSSAPVYVSGGHGLSAYSNGGSSSVGLQISLLGSSQHGLSLGSSGTSSNYNLPAHSESSSPSHSVTGGLVIASSPHGSSPSYSSPSYSSPSYSSHSYSSPSYSSPSYSSASSHSTSGLSSSSGIHGASSKYTLPISSGSHGISALSSSGHHASSGSHGSSGTHSGFSGISSGGSSYELPIASGSHSTPGSSISHINYLPSHLSGSSHSVPAAPGISHVGSSGYPGGGGAYSFSSNYAGSGSSPIVAHAGNHGYTPMYYSSSNSYGTPADSHGAYASISPRYLSYTLGPKIYNVDSDSAKYDTISYSVPNGK